MNHDKEAVEAAEMFSSNAFSRTEAGFENPAWRHRKNCFLAGVAYARERQGEENINPEFKEGNHLYSLIDGMHVGNEVYFQKEDLKKGFNLIFDNLHLTSYQTVEPKRVGYILKSLHYFEIAKLRKEHQALIAPLIEALEEIAKTNHGMDCDHLSNLLALKVLENYKKQTGVKDE